MIRYVTLRERMIFGAIALALGLFALYSFTGITPRALAQKPPSPPGQGECGHGNSQKPCKEDPQPDRGKDCEEHGPKEGGVNEDHCAGTPTTPEETTPEETTPEETTSTPTETTPDEDTVIRPPTTLVPPRTPETPSPTPSPGEQPTSQPETPSPSLEEELEEQAKKNGATPQTTAPASGSSATAPADALPYTGLPLALWALIGAGLTGAGAWLRRRP